MAVDLEKLRLDIPDEDFSKPDGVSSYWRVATVVLLLIAAGLAYLSFFYQPGSADREGITVTTHTVAFVSLDAETDFTAGGWIEPQWPYPVTISALVPGRIDSLYAVEGADVKRGKTVAILNSAAYETELIEVEALVAAAKQRVKAAAAQLALLNAGTRPEEIEIAKAARDRSQAKLDRLLAGFREEDIAGAEAEVRGATAFAEQKRSRANRMNELAKSRTIPGSKAEECEAEARAAEERVLSLKQELLRLQAGYREVDVDEARTELAESIRKLELLQAGTRAEAIQHAEAVHSAAKADLEAAEAAVELAEWRIDQCIVECPRNGRILEVLAPQGSVLEDRNMALFTMYDPGAMQCRVDVRQEQAASLFLGQRCTIKLAARKGQPYVGQVIRVNPQANLARDTVRVIVGIAEPDENLRIDMTVTVDFHPKLEVAEGEALPLVLPPAAIQLRDGKSYVFLIRDGTANLREVELGEETANGFVVVSGVVQGDMVAVTALELLTDGARIRLDLEAQD